MPCLNTSTSIFMTDQGHCGKDYLNREKCNVGMVQFLPNLTAANTRVQTKIISQMLMDPKVLGYDTFSTKAPLPLTRMNLKTDKNLSELALCFH